MKRYLLAGILLSLLLLSAIGYASVAAQAAVQAAATPAANPSADAPARNRSIRVSGNAQVNVAPDEVVLTLGVESWSARLSAAKANNDQIVARVLKVANNLKIPDKYVQTDYLNIQPSFENYERNKITGYYVRRNVVITLKDLTQFEDLLSDALEAGVNYVHGIDFRTTELRKYRDQARALALQAAQEKAAAMAGKLGGSIGEPLSIEEANYYWYSPYSSYWSYASGGGMSQNVVQNAPGASTGSLESGEEALAPGQIAVSATVNVEFELK